MKDKMKNIDIDIRMKEFRWTLNDELFYDARGAKGRRVSGPIWNGPVGMLNAIRSFIRAQMEKPHEER